MSSWDRWMNMQVHDHNCAGIWSILAVIRYLKGWNMILEHDKVCLYVITKIIHAYSHYIYKCLGKVTHKALRSPSNDTARNHLSKSQRTGRISMWSLPYNLTQPKCLVMVIHPKCLWTNTDWKNISQLQVHPSSPNAHGWRWKRKSTRKYHFPLPKQKMVTWQFFVTLSWDIK